MGGAGGARLQHHRGRTSPRTLDSAETGRQRAGCGVQRVRPARRSSSMHCDFVAGCDGFHGLSRTAVPEGVLRTYERTYPFAWIGVLAGSTCPGG
ncbi:FAD-dependent monooxygenase [Micromonospora zamorensis]|uniref:FAD-dependent monooxygenase n=1 Tax=Micromonospora zamorensis TaxID=709883 RepID=UPI0033A24FA3